MEQKKFMIRRFDSIAQIDQFKSFMEEYGGVYVDDEQKCDYIIVPLTYASQDVQVHPKEVINLLFHRFLTVKIVVKTSM